MKKVSCRVLLVDDAKADHAIIGRYLREAQSSAFTLECAPSYDAAVNFLAGGEYDTCLIDYSLGGNRSGLELIDHITAARYELPIIFLTGLGNLEIAFEAMRLGAIEYLDKNALTPILLERTVRYAIENFRIRKALQSANDELELRVEERTKALMRSNEELERFAYVVSHELQLPLKTVVTYLDEIAGCGHAGPVNHETQKDEFSIYFLAKAQSSVRRMLAMIQNVLNYSRLPTQTRPMTVIALHEVLQSVLMDLAAEIEAKDARIEFGELPFVHGHPGMLHQVFKNLIGNSLKFTQRNIPEIRIEITRNADEWVCAVRDNGVGVAVEDHDKIFLMFHRGASPTHIGGDGIGLAICRRIVELHGGKIWIESAPDHGAAVYFTLSAMPPCVDGRSGNGNGFGKPVNGISHIPEQHVTHPEEVDDNVENSVG